MIGRNEGRRLEACLRSVVGRAPVVYVDSGSDDGSPALAEALSAEVIELDRSAPFTAARSRNAGFGRLLECWPEVSFVQFVDGDCEMVSTWFDHAVNELRRRPQVAVVCGHLREQRPEASLFNRMCEMEWLGPTGDIATCGGIFMIQVDAFREVGGFHDALIAGEEPDLCLRLRRTGRRIVRLDAEMARHDAALDRFSKWWRRSVRSGHAAAEGVVRHGAEYPLRRDVWSAIFWAVGVPVASAATAWVASGIGTVVALALGVGVAVVGYSILALRLYRDRRRRGFPVGDSIASAFLCVLGKWGEMCGVSRFAFNRLCNKRTGLIEYK